MRFDLAAGFPLVTTKRVHFKSIAYELLWFLRGETNTKYLREHGVSIWDEWADANGELGPVYGKQWRSWPTPRWPRRSTRSRRWCEQLRTNPDSRRIIVSAWNVGELDQMKLMPCHAFFQFYVSDKRLSCQLYQRSADIFLGVPFNIASYALLTHMLAQQCDLEVGEFIWTGGDCHLYSNHLEQVDEQLSRVPLTLPKLNAHAPAADHFRLHVRGLSDRELSASSGHQGARCRMTASRRRKTKTDFDQSQPKRGGPPIVDARRSSRCAIRRCTAAACSPSPNIAKGTRIFEYLGDRVSHAAADERYEDHDENDNHTFLFIVDKHTVIDAGVGGNDARFINHHCEGNCESVIENRRVFIDAARDIAPGEELGYDYEIGRDKDDPPNVDEIYACRCGSPKCRGSMLEAAPKPKKESGSRPSKRPSDASRARHARPVVPKRKRRGERPRRRA